MSHRQEHESGLQKMQLQILRGNKDCPASPHDPTQPLPSGGPGILKTGVRLLGKIKSDYWLLIFDC